MVQTVVLVLLLLGEAALVYFNPPSLQSRVTLGAPGIQATFSHLALMASVAGAIVLMWLAGVVDRATLERRIHERDATLHAMGQEMLRMKSTAYDQERPPLADIRARLEAMDRDLRAIRMHFGDRVIVAKDREQAGDRERTHIPAGL